MAITGIQVELLLHQLTAVVKLLEVLQLHIHHILVHYKTEALEKGDMDMIQISTMELEEVVAGMVEEGPLMQEPVVVDLVILVQLLSVGQQGCKMEFAPVMAMPVLLLFPQINYFTFLTYQILLYSHLSRREENIMDDTDEGQNISKQRSCSFANFFFNYFISYRMCRK